MTPDQLEVLAPLTDKKVLVTYRDYKASESNPPAVELEGTLKKAGLNGVLVVPKGTSSGIILLPHELINVTEIVAKVSLKIRKMPPVEPSKVKQHLLDRHGLPFAAVNELTDEEAVVMHDKHHLGEIGHRHEADAASVAPDAEGAVAAA